MTKKLNVLVIGSGGREHAITWKIKQSKLLGALYASPGNPGTAHTSQNLVIDLQSGFSELKQVALDKEIDLIIVGPEAPLVDGIADVFDDTPIAVLGPHASAAQLEGSKAFAKRFMEQYKIPTAQYGQFTKETVEKAYDHIDKMNTPIVLKADGLAAGKGVLILDSKEHAKQELQNMFSGKFGTAGDTVVIEEFLDGIEFSVFALTDAKSYKILPVAKDYKRIGEGDTGLNTGGMGAVSPVPFVDDLMMKKVIERIVNPTLKGIQDRKMTYRGFIFFGLISVGGEPYVIEYNCRLGDPETEAILPRIDQDFLLDCYQAATDTLESKSVDISPNTAATVICVSGGYPEKYQKGKAIDLPSSVDKGTTIFHAGTAIDQKNKLVTNGGRVLAITSIGESREEAIQKSMRIAEEIDYEGKYYRTDIGFDL